VGNGTSRAFGRREGHRARRHRAGERESFLLDGGSPFYRCYETAAGKYVAVGAIEPQFCSELLVGLGLSFEEVPNQLEIGSYPQMRDVFTARFASRTRDEWAETFAGTDACVTQC
jgi:alpha-methylacyl-CoA racemase